MEKARFKFWYSVNGSGQAMVFASQPVRDEHRRVWVGTVNSAVIRFFDFLETDCGYVLPDITWKDDAVELEMSVSAFMEGGELWHT